jgi:hypothetical protein
MVISLVAEVGLSLSEFFLFPASTVSIIIFNSMQALGKNGSELAKREDKIK